MVNNAGIFNNSSTIFDTSYEDVANSFAVNYFAPVMITKAVASKMIRTGGGSIINISSAGSIHPGAGETTYGASKAALNLFTQSVAMELAPFGVRMNAIAFGPLQTEMFESLDEKIQKKVTKRVAMKRAATFEEASEIVLYLASDNSKYTTGSIIQVDGGFR